MREIKFRGINKNTGRWVYGDLLHKDGKTYIGYWIEDNDSPSGNGYIECEVVPETVGQYTGLKDENEKETYDGDILSDNEEWTGVIRYKKGGYYLNCGTVYSPWLIVVSVAGRIDDFNVIGNIHERPELLGVEDNSDIEMDCLGCTLNKENACADCCRDWDNEDE